MADKFNKQREQLEIEHKRLADELAQLQNNKSSAEERREGVRKTMMTNPILTYDHSQRSCWEWS